MPIGYINEPGAVVHLRGGSLIVEKEGAQLASWELDRIEAVCLNTGVHITQPAMRAVLDHGVEIALTSGEARLLGRVTSFGAKNVALRLAQYALYHDSPRRLTLARSVIDAKLVNARANVLRFIRTHQRQDLRTCADELSHVRSRVAAADSAATLLGLEGHAARLYFAALGSMCLGELRFEHRSARPPLDPINALLSLGYTFLVRDLALAAGVAGFEPQIGFLHDIASDRPSLALDLAEPLRTGLIDRFVLFLANTRVFTAADFESRDGGCYLRKPAFSGFIRQYHRILSRHRVDPQSGCRLPYRRHLQLQTERFAAHLLRGGPIPDWFRIDGG